MENTTIDPIAGDVVDDNNFTQSSSSSLVVGSNMAENTMLGDTFAADHSPESYIHSDHGLESSIPSNFATVDNPREHDGRDHATPHHAAHGDQTPCKLEHNPEDDKIGQDTPELYIGVGDVHDQGSPDTYMEVDGASDAYIPSHSLLNPITIYDTISSCNRPPKFEDDVVSAPNAAPKESAPTQMHLFMRFPPELRDMIWEIAIEDAREPDLPVFHRCVQRFRFNLAYDARRVKPGQDKSWGWVACFTPLRINARRPLLFLRASLDSRVLLMRKMSFLTVHELPIDANGQYMAPRKCHMPFNFAKDDFCVEGITHGLEEAKRDKEDKDAVWDPEKLPLAELLDNALGLRFAPRIKRLAIIPHPRDAYWAVYHFIQTTNGGDMATLAKRFPALVTVKSALPQKRWYADESPSFPFPHHILWKAASLRGKGKGGPSKMSQEDREALYVIAWRRIFGKHWYFRPKDMAPELFDDRGCLM